MRNLSPLRMTPPSSARMSRNRSTRHNKGSSPPSAQRLTPSSSSSSSSGGSSSNNHRGSSTKFSKNIQDKTILRGAALLKHNLLQGIMGTGTDESVGEAPATMPALSLEEDDYMYAQNENEDDWSVPSFRQNQSLSLSLQSRTSQSFSMRGDDEDDYLSHVGPEESSSAPPHWANLALNQSSNVTTTSGTSHTGGTAASSQRSASASASSQKRFLETSLLDTEEEPAAAAAAAADSSSSNNEEINYEVNSDWDSFLSTSRETTPQSAKSNRSALEWDSMLTTNTNTNSQLPPPPPSRPPPITSPQVSETSTHVTTMGRGKSLKLKVYEYNVQRNDQDADEEYSYDDSYLDEAPQQYSSPPAPQLPKRTLMSPNSMQFRRLQKNEAYHHARAAGYVWQSLVGQFVRFPREWWDGARAPLLGAGESVAEGRAVPQFPWKYLARHKVQRHQVCNHLVKNRGSAGRLLLHFVVKDFCTHRALMDICVGCFHPNARGIRKTEDPVKEDEKSREVWMAVRKRVAFQDSLVEAVLCKQRTFDSIGKDAPLGASRKVSNTNMRAIFGDQPPLNSLIIGEGELYDKLQLAADLDPSMAQAPALLLLQEFLTLG